MQNTNGEVIEDNSNASPTCYLHGGSSIAPFLQSQFEGLGLGDIKTIFLNGGSENISFKIIIDKLRPASGEELILGYPVDENANCNSDCNCYSAQF
jgi:hypothetical protein